MSYRNQGNLLGILPVLRSNTIIMKKGFASKTLSAPLSPFHNPFIQPVLEFFGGRIEITFPLVSTYPLHTFDGVG